MIEKCPVCRTTGYSDVVSLRNVPLVANATVTPDQGPRVPMGDLDLVVCHECGHLYNRVFDAGRLDYDASYENTLHFSPVFRTHAAALADRLVADFSLSGATIAEIGCGPGHLLSMLLERGADRAFGFDPSYDPGRLGAPNDARLQISQDPFPADGSLPADLVITQHVVEHLERPIEMLEQIRRAINPSGHTYVEVPNGAHMVGACALWDLIYEHVSYFVPTSLVRACEEAGLEPMSVSTSFGDQFLSVDARAGTRTEHPTRATEHDVEAARAFGRRVRDEIERASDHLSELTAVGPVALWGAGSKGTTYLNVVDGDSLVEAVVDINPRKSGTGVPGTDHVIVLPEELTAVRPATVLVANPLYVDEVTAQLRDLDLDARVESLWT